MRGKIILVVAFILLSQGAVAQDSGGSCEEFTAEIQKSEVPNYPVTVTGCFPEETQQINLNIGFTDKDLLGAPTSHAGSSLRTQTDDILCPNNLENCATDRIDFEVTDEDSNSYRLDVRSGKDPSEDTDVGVEINMLPIKETITAGFAGGNPSEIYCESTESELSNLDLKCIEKNGEIQKADDLEATVVHQEGNIGEANWGEEFSLADGQELSLPPGCNDKVSVVNPGGGINQLKMNFDDQSITLTGLGNDPREGWVGESETWKSSKGTKIVDHDLQGGTVFMTLECESGSSGKSGDFLELSNEELGIGDTQSISVKNTEADPLSNGWTLRVKGPNGDTVKMDSDSPTAMDLTVGMSGSYSVELQEQFEGPEQYLSFAFAPEVVETVSFDVIGDLMILDRCGDEISGGDSEAVESCIRSDCGGDLSNLGSNPQCTGIVQSSCKYAYGSEGLDYSSSGPEPCRYFESSSGTGGGDDTDTGGGEDTDSGDTSGDGSDSGDGDGSDSGDTSGTVTVKVTLPGGDPVEGAVVSWERSQGFSEGKTGTTDDNGEVEFEETLPEGNNAVEYYSIEVDCDGQTFEETKGLEGGEDSQEFEVSPPVASYCE